MCEDIPFFPNQNDGGSSVKVEPFDVTENGEYTAPRGVAYSPVTVDVPNSYAAADEGKVVSDGALVAQTSLTVTANDTYDTTLINEVTVSVPSGGGAFEWPTDNKTHIWLTLTSFLSFVFPTTSDVTVDWGDGTTSTGSNVSHTYATPGDYEIVVDGGTINFMGSSYPSWIDLPSDGSNYYQGYLSSVRRVYMGANALLNTSDSKGFYLCSKLEAIKISEYATRITATTGDHFTLCYGLKEVLGIRGEVGRSLGGHRPFDYCHSLYRLVFDVSCTGISYVLGFYCRNLKILDFSALTAVPTLRASTDLDGFAPGYQILVPSALYNDWIAATNWSAVASHIVAV